MKASTVAGDAARLAGETIGTFEVESEILGDHYTRRSGPASVTLEDAAQGRPWYVDYSGVTHVTETRTAPTPSGDSYQILKFDPLQQRAILSVDDLSQIVIGVVLTEGVDEPLTVTALEIVITPESFRVIAWGQRQQGAGDSLKRIVERLTVQELNGIYRYRVSQMAGDRVDLQVARTASGLPDQLRVAQWGGSGMHAILALGSEVLVQFIDGNRADPVITHYPGKGQGGHIPEAIEIAGGGNRISRQGDLVQSGGPGASIILGTGGDPAFLGVPYLISFSANPLDIGPLAKPLFGAGSTGSPKVRSG